MVPFCWTPVLRDGRLVEGRSGEVYMETYYINLIKPGEPEKTVLKTEANSLQAAWLGAKSWFMSGEFYIYPKDNYAAGQRFVK